jgi:hypothetical protein
MDPKDPSKPEENRMNQPDHEGGDPVTLKEDPAQFYPTGGAGLVNPADATRTDVGGPLDRGYDKTAK